MEKIMFSIAELKLAVRCIKASEQNGSKVDAASFIAKATQRIERMEAAAQKGKKARAKHHPDVVKVDELNQRIQEALAKALEAYTMPKAESK